MNDGRERQLRRARGKRREDGREEGERRRGEAGERAWVGGVGRKRERQGNRMKGGSESVRERGSLAAPAPPRSIFPGRAVSVFPVGFPRWPGAGPGRFFEPGRAVFKRRVGFSGDRDGLSANSPARGPASTCSADANAEALRRVAASDSSGLQLPNRGRAVPGGAGRQELERGSRRDAHVPAVLATDDRGDEMAPRTASPAGRSFAAGRSGVRAGPTGWRLRPRARR